MSWLGRLLREIHFDSLMVMYVKMQQTRKWQQTCSGKETWHFSLVIFLLFFSYKFFKCLVNLKIYNA